MLFKRRKPPTFRELVRVALWPRRSWKRSALYIVKRVRRQGGTPHVVALGIAAGAFAACLPYWGLQIATAGAIAWLFRASISAAVLSTFIANPITLPIIWLLSYKMGDAILGGTGTMDVDQIQQGLARSGELLMSGAPNSLETAGTALWPVLMPISVGSLPLGVMVATVFYFASKPLLESYQSRRILALHH